MTLRSLHRWALLLLAASLLLPVFAGAVSADSRYPKDELILRFFVDGWEVHWGDDPRSGADWETLTREHLQSLERYEGMLWLRRTMTGIERHDTHIFLHHMKYVEAYMDHARVYAFNMEEQNHRINPYMKVHAVPISQDDEGRLLELRLKWDRIPMNPVWNLVGSRETIIFDLLNYEWKRLMYAVLCLALGLGSLGLFLRRLKERIYGWFALLCLSAGVGFVLLSSTPQWFINLDPVYYWRELLLPLAMLAFIGFYGEALGRSRSPIYTRTIAIVLGFLLVETAVAVLDDTWYGYMWTFGMAPLFIGVFSMITYTLVQFILKNRSQEAAWLTAGYVILVVSCMAHLMINMTVQGRIMLDLVSRGMQDTIVNILPTGFMLFIGCLAMVLLLRFSGVYRQLKTYADALAHKNETLAQFDRLKDDFLQNTSHELRTPLHGIAGLSESLLAGAAGPVNERTRASLGMMLGSANRLLHLVNDILDFNRLKHEDIRIVPRVVDLRQSAETVMTMLTPLTAAKGLTCRIEIEESGRYVLADAARLEQILYNLLGNAIKYTPDGSVTIRATAADDGSGMAAIAVIDTGRGIDPEAAARLFEPFASSDGSSGTGLGLALTKRLIELHRGEIRIGPAEHGRGTRVDYTLPLADSAALEGAYAAGNLQAGSGAAAREALFSEHARLFPRWTSDSEEPASPAAAAEAEPEAGSGAEAEEEAAAQAPLHPIILIVDDEPVNVQVLYNFFSGKPYRVEHAQSGEEALARLAGEERPALLLLDIMMPGMNGYEVCRRIRERWTPSELPVILLSARSRVSDLTNGFDAGANDYVPKPFAQGELLSRVETQLKLAAFHQSLDSLVQERTKELEEKSEALLGSFKETAEALAEISVLEERSRIAHEIHDVVGHTLTAAVVQLEAAQKLAPRSPEDSLLKVAGAQELVRKGLDDIRRSVRLLKDDGYSFDLSYEARELIDEMELHTGIRIETDIDIPPMDGILQKVVYHALQEGLTNGIRHGACDWFRFTLTQADGQLRFLLLNDGLSYGDAKPGFGLSAMMERVHLLGGEMTVGQPPAHAGKSEAGRPWGCALAITLPLPPQPEAAPQAEEAS